jgi:hypothetical protein
VPLSPASLETQALMEALERVAPTSPTACGEWNAHDIVAHLAAGGKENADLIEAKLAGLPQRATRGFAEREAPFAALPDDELRRALVVEGQRKRTAIDSLAESDEPFFEFTGRTFTVAQAKTHTRSEAAIHRWDLVGDDDLSEQLLSQVDLTAHAVDVLNSLPSLFEAPGSRAEHAGLASDLRIVLRAPGTNDVIYGRTARGATFELANDCVGAADAMVTTDAVNRLLTIWGRRSTERSLTIDTDSVAPELLESVLWPAAVPWPPPKEGLEGRS